MTRKERIEQLRFRIAMGVTVAAVLAGSTAVIASTYRTIQEVDKVLAEPIKSEFEEEIAPVQYNTLVQEAYIPYVLEIGQQYQVSPELILAIIETESGGNPDAVSSSGCIGLMQIKPSFAIERMERLGVWNLYDPYENILIGVDTLEELFRKYKDLPAVLMAYNEGEYSGAIEKADSGRYSWYATKIMQRAEELEKEAGKQEY